MRKKLFRCVCVCAIERGVSVYRSIECQTSNALATTAIANKVQTYCICKLIASCRFFHSHSHLSISLSLLLPLFARTRAHSLASMHICIHLLLVCIAIGIYILCAPNLYFFPNDFTAQFAQV